MIYCYGVYHQVSHWQCHKFECNACSAYLCPETVFGARSAQTFFFLSQDNTLHISWRFCTNVAPVSIDGKCTLVRKQLLPGLL